MFVRLLTEKHDDEMSFEFLIDPSTTAVGIFCDTDDFMCNNLIYAGGF